MDRCKKAIDLTSALQTTSCHKLDQEDRHEKAGLFRLGFALALIQQYT